MFRSSGPVKANGHVSDILSYVSVFDMYIQLLFTGSSISRSDHTEGTYPEETSWSTGYRGLPASTTQHYSEWY